MAVGFLAALALAKWVARKDGLAPDAVVDISLVLLVAGIVGSKLLLVVVDLFGGQPASQVFSWGTLRAGGAIHGGILAGTLAFFWRAHALKLPVAKVSDALACAVPLGQAIGRLGCLAAGCCYGAFCEKPWAIVFHSHEAARFGTPLDVPLHPTQLYFCLSNLATVAVLLAIRAAGRTGPGEAGGAGRAAGSVPPPGQGWASWAFRRFPGQLAAVYLILEGLFRLVLETWRGDFSRGFWLNVSWLSTGRMTAFLFILIGIGIWAWYARKEVGGS
jgi:phosphatidylglycerol:prolipoprotein diacylglycerol transferase